VTVPFYFFVDAKLACTLRLIVKHFKEDEKAMFVTQVSLLREIFMSFVSLIINVFYVII